MLELPECQTLARQLRETVLGRRIQSVVANASPHGFAFYFGEPARYHDRLTGLPLEQADAFGGYVELQAQHMRILLNDGINLRYLSPQETRPKKHQLLIELDDGSALCCTVQMYGAMQVFAEGENTNSYYRVALDKPCPLSEDFNEAYFETLLQQSKPKLSAKAFLATEQRIPGLGNGVLQDILFRAGIHPKNKLDSLSDDDRAAMFRSVKELLTDMSRQGGRDTEKNLFGNKGGYHTILSRFTVRYPCPVCSGSLVRQAYLGGNVYFCPTCQPARS